jgi:exodeoxyribonuclease VII small subunit
MSFEADLARIESIVSELESDGLGLDQALRLFEEGVERLRAAAAALAQAEEKVRVLVEQTDGSFTLADLDG